MSAAHAVIHVARGFETQLANVYLPVIKLSGKEDLNHLWRIIGQYNTDVYVTGHLTRWTLRQLRAFCFIFVSRRGQIVNLMDGPAPQDISFPNNYPKDSLSKDFETKIGVDRMHLRKRFGNLLRGWTMKFATEFHGCEAETLMMADPRRHTIYGLPPSPPAIGIDSTVYEPYLNDLPTDEKLVSLLDYMLFSADIVYYVGSGDLRTVMKFRHKDLARFNRARWICIDPISPVSPAPNIICYKSMITHPGQLRELKIDGDDLEHMLIWDVRSDKTGRTPEEWEIVTQNEDAMGACIALYNRDWLALACVKYRIPAGSRAPVGVFTSMLVPQPSAPTTMYELRSIMRLEGFSHVDRSHIPKARDLVVEHSDCVRLVQNFHGVARGKMLKKSLLEYLHISRVDGLEHRSGKPRVDLFYLTNKCNSNKKKKIHEVLALSNVATVWIGEETLTGYDDFKFSSQTLMLRYSSKERMVLDGNGVILYLMWKGAFKEEPRKIIYDPSWAMKFGVVMRRSYGEDIVPDVSLCRFVGLRRLSTQYRLNTDFIHRRADVLKRLGLDVSGHLFVALVSGAYCFDMHWWVKMIKEWSVLNERDKLVSLADAKADIIEWREENANAPWHRPEDLAAALSLVSSLQIPVVSNADIAKWLEILR